jgi:transcriptional regulator GlxA family with amidase domain
MELQQQMERVSIAIGQQTAFGVPALERHYTVSELAKLWLFSENTIRRLFSQEPGVIKISRQRTRVKRGYTSMRITSRQKKCAWRSGNFIPTTWRRILRRHCAPRLPTI